MPPNCAEYETDNNIILSTGEVFTSEGEEEEMSASPIVDEEEDACLKGGKKVEVKMGRNKCISVVKLQIQLESQQHLVIFL